MLSTDYVVPTRNEFRLSQTLLNGFTLIILTMLTMARLGTPLFCNCRILCHFFFVGAFDILNSLSLLICEMETFGYENK